MPTYLVHGFRWSRASIVIHTVLQNLDDAAPNWIMAPASSITLLNSFYSMYDFLPPSSPPPAIYPSRPPPVEKLAPEQQQQQQQQQAKKEDNGPRTLTKVNKGSMSSLRSLGRKNKPPNVKLGGSKVNGHKASTSSSDSRPTASLRTSASEAGKKEPKFNEWSVVKLLEQYDPEDTQTASQPYAYVADYMVQVKLGVSLNEEMLKYEADQKAEEAILNAHNGNGPPTPGMSTMGASGDLMSPGLSVREARRRSRRLGWFEKLRDGLQKGEDIGWYVVFCGDEERVFPTIEKESEEDSEEERPVRTPRSAGLRGMFKRKDIPEEE